MTGQFRVSDLIAYLEDVRVKHGDVLIYVYSTEEKRDMPMLAESLLIGQHGNTRLSISAITLGFEEWRKAVRP